MKIKQNFKLIFAFLFFLSFSNFYSQSLGDYRSIATGNWTNLATWQYYNGTAWVTPSGSTPQGYPSQFAGTNKVTIQATHTITFLNSYVTTTFPSFVINGTLLLNGTGGSPIFNIKANSLVVTPNLTPAATINFTTKGILTLPENATIQNGALSLSGSCTANQGITIGTVPLSTCAGAGQVALLFAQMMTGGGTLDANPLSTAPNCAGNIINLTGTTNGMLGTGTTYTWTITNPLGQITTVNSQNTSISNALQGTYLAKLRVTTTYTSTVFSNEETIQVVVNPLPVVALTPNSSVCSNTIKSIIASGASTCSWTSSVAGTLFLDAQATQPYAGSNVATIYVKTLTTAIITGTGTSNGCSNSSTSTITVNAPAVWDGTMWSIAPSIDRDMVFNSSYSSIADLEGCSCLVTSGNVVINSNHDMTLERNVTVSGGSLTFENNSNLFQITDTANFGNITVKRQSSALKRLDYTLWSSPVSGQNLFNFSMATLTNRFYEFNPLTNLYNVTPSNVNFSNAKGYLVRMPNNHPTVATIYNGVFTGVPSNGSYNKTIVDGGSSLTRFNAIGNPYPSALMMDDFINQNLANIEGTLWFWRKTNDDLNPVSYSTCTTAGCTVNNGHSYTDDNLISTGQGFLVQAKAGATSVNFTNSMRSKSNVNQFFRSNTATTDRFWLELKNESNVSFGQTLIAYIPEASLDYDNGKDGVRYDDTSTAIFTNINSIAMTIQARPIFENSDAFPLVFKTNVAANYSISIKQLEGIFSENQDVFIKDNQTNVIHNLKLASYNFNSLAGVFENRFQIQYQPASLNTNSNLVVDDKITVFKKGEEVIIKLSAGKIQSLKIFDLTGIELLSKANVNATSYNFNSGNQNQVFIVKVITNENKQYTSKIIN